MSKQPDLANLFVPEFTHSPVRADSRLMILSTCLICGEAKVVSSVDGTLEAWENGHRCECVMPVKPCA